jgi:preprotein translocase subunit YajC
VNQRKESDVLVLHRKEGDAVLITGGIEVTVVQIRGNQVKLGFTLIRRAELPPRETPRPAPDGGAAG